MVDIKTNNVPRDIVSGYELSEKERANFDYMGDIDSGSFFRYRGQVYDMGEFMLTETKGTDSPFKNWHGYNSDSYFSGTLIRIVNNGESVIVARYYS